MTVDGGTQIGRIRQVPFLEFNYWSGIYQSNNQCDNGSVVLSSRNPSRHLQITDNFAQTLILEDKMTRKIRKIFKPLDAEFKNWRTGHE